MKFLLNSNMQHFYNTEINVKSSLKGYNTKNKQLTIISIAFSLNVWHYKLGSRCVEIQLRGLQISDVTRYVLMTSDLNKTQITENVTYA